MHRREAVFLLRRLLVAGGDGRMLRLARLLAGEGFQTATLGLRPEDEKKADIGAAQAILFPYPHAVREGLVPTLTGLSLRPGDVLEGARPGAVVLAGGGLEAYMAEAKELRLLSYAKSEAFLERNAALSAEGALAQAMGRTERALMDMAVLVTGYGRFARALARRLGALGAEVWVAARRGEQRLTALSDGMRAVSFDALPEVAGHMDMVLNTVPAQVLGTQVLERLPKGTWLLELASAPYGFDRAEAEAMGLRVEVLPALPARYAPSSAAHALKQVCVELLREASL